MLRVATPLIAAALMIIPSALAAGGDAPPPTARWQTPPSEVMKVLHAPQLPRVWTAPTGKHLMLADPVVYPRLAELAAPLHELAVRGSGGTARLVLLPFEDHGYRARESVEHVLWEQLRWFDSHVKNAE